MSELEGKNADLEAELASLQEERNALHAMVETTAAAHGDIIDDLQVRRLRWLKDTWCGSAVGGGVAVRVLNPYSPSPLPIVVILMAGQGQCRQRGVG